MDADGYLPVRLIATFPRVKNMTQGYNMVLSAIESSEELELTEDSAYVRTIHEPQKWPILDSVVPTPVLTGTTTSVATTPPIMVTTATPLLSGVMTTAANASTGVMSPVIPESPLSPIQPSLSHPAPAGGVAEMLNPNVPEFVPKGLLNVEKMSRTTNTESNSVDSSVGTTTVTSENAIGTAKRDKMDSELKKTESVTESNGSVEVAQVGTQTGKGEEEQIADWKEVKRKIKSKERRRLNSTNSETNSTMKEDELTFSFEDDLNELPGGKPRHYSSSRYSL